MDRRDALAVGDPRIEDETVGDTTLRVRRSTLDLRDALCDFGRSEVARGDRTRGLDDFAVVRLQALDTARVREQFVPAIEECAHACGVGDACGIAEAQVLGEDACGVRGSEVPRAAYLDLRDGRE